MRVASKQMKNEIMLRDEKVRIRNTIIRDTRRRNLL